MDMLEMKSIRGLAENREALVHLLVQYRDGRQGLAVLHDVLDTGTVVIDIFPGSTRTVAFLHRGLEPADEGSIIILHLLELGTLFGALDGILSEGIGNDLHLVALLQQQGRNLGIALEDIDELRLSGFDLHLV